MTASRPRSVSPGLFLALVVVAIIFQFLVADRNLNIYDESLQLFGAEHVLRGQIPYRDFWTMYGPAQFYVLAGFFKFFGTTALTARVYDALIKACLASICFALVSQFARRTIASITFAFVILWMACGGSQINFPVYPALLCSLISAIFLSRYIRGPQTPRKIFFAGLLVGATATFRHDFGVYICFAEVIPLCWFIAFQPGHVSTRTAWSKLRGPVLIYFAGVLLIALPVLLWLLWKVPLDDLFYQLIYVPAKIYPKVRNLPFQHLGTLRNLLNPLTPETRNSAQQWMVIFPLLISLLGLSALLTSRRSSRPLFETDAQRFIFALLLLLAPLLFIKGLIRVVDIHELPSIIVALCLFAILVSRRHQLSRILFVPLLVCTVFLAACSLPVLLHTVADVRSNSLALLRPSSASSFRIACHPPAGLQRARCLIVDPKEIAAIQYVEQRTTPADRIYLGAGRHDKLYQNNVGFYFLADRFSVTKWYDLHPGVETTLPIQNEIIDSLRIYAPKLIVLDTSQDDVQELNASRNSSGVTALDDYIHSHYSPQARFGTFIILAPDQH
jgi:hypothetical protein